MAETPATQFDLIEHTRARHARTVLVDWMLGNSCSYACSYCPKHLHDGSARWQTSDKVLGFFDQLHDHYVRDRGREVWLQFTGGEPTMHPQIARLLQAASARGFSVSLISNASRTLRFWSKVAADLDAVILTYHSEFAQLEHFLGVTRIVGPLMPVHINVTMIPDRFDAILDDAKALRDALPDATIALKPLRLDFRTQLYDYTDYQRSIMQRGLPAAGQPGGTTPRGTMTVHRQCAAPEVLRANELVMRDVNRWSGYRCNAGLESLRVSGDGTVTRAACSVGGALGQLGLSIALPREPVLCTRDTCGCIADILITKIRPHGLAGQERRPVRTAVNDAQHVDSLALD